MTGRRVSFFRFVAWFAVLALLLAGLGIACGDADEKPSTPTSEPRAGVQTMTDEGTPGVSDGRVLFAQSAAFSGTAPQLGNDTALGIRAAFHERNQAGGVHGRQLELTTLDDFYEPDDAYANTRRLIDNQGVFALIGEVGSPTSRLGATRWRRSWERERRICT